MFRYVVKSIMQYSSWSEAYSWTGSAFCLKSIWRRKLRKTQRTQEALRDDWFFFFHHDTMIMHSTQIAFEIQSHIDADMVVIKHIGLCALQWCFCVSPKLIRINIKNTNFNWIVIDAFYYMKLLCPAPLFAAIDICGSIDWICGGCGFG